MTNLYGVVGYDLYFGAKDFFIIFLEYIQNRLWFLSWFLVMDTASGFIISYHPVVRSYGCFAEQPLGFILGDR